MSGDAAAMPRTERIAVFLDGDAPFSCVIPTRFADVDSMGHINNVATAQIIEDARTRFTDWMGLLADMPAGVRSVTASIQVDYVDEAFYPEPYMVHAAVTHIGRSSWSYLLTARQQQRIVASAMSTQTSKTAGGPWLLPEPMRAVLRRFMKIV